MQIFVGWDSREEEAYDVCVHSLRRHTSHPVNILPLKQAELRAQGIYQRGADPLASTEFTYTRFLVPALAQYKGWALFCDCDFLWLGDVEELFSLRQERYALMCVQHEYRPTETVKMDGAPQSVYPRKNWSSLMLFNCAHPANKALTPEVVNQQSGAFLHRLQWLDDALIGAVPLTWNWLEGWNDPPSQGTPKVVHYTRGGPWFENWQNVAYADLWRQELELVNKNK
jgi:lipopolysaccharide biosynthesis glycosyltransferase